MRVALLILASLFASHTAVTARLGLSELSEVQPRSFVDAILYPHQRRLAVPAYDWLRGRARRFTGVVAAGRSWSASFSKLGAAGRLRFSPSGRFLSAL